MEEENVPKLNELSRDAILSKDDIKIVKVAAPLWGGFVYVKSLTGTERATLDDFYTTDDKLFQAGLLTLSVCDKDGKRLFKDNDVVAISEKSAAAIDQVFWSTHKLNKIGAREVEEIAKNLPAVRRGDSISNLPSS